MSILPLPADEVKAIIARRAGIIDRFLLSCLTEWPGTPRRLRESMQYSINAGGKRLRPVLCMAAAHDCGLEEEIVLPFAGAIELIHTYSLVHDDLPAMDNDDFRRGRPSNHKQFDEATAILAGDGLLTDAFAVAATTKVASDNLLEALRQLAMAAGSAGMVGGQMLDMLFTGKKDISLKEVAHMQALKTGAMITVACECGAILAGASRDHRQSLASYGASLGKAFQIADDILDITGDENILGKPVGSDEAEGKNTYPSLAGLEESRKLAREEANKAIMALRPGPESGFLAGIADYVVSRSK